MIRDASFGPQTQQGGRSVRFTPTTGRVISVDDAIREVKAGDGEIIFEAFRDEGGGYGFRMFMTYADDTKADVIQSRNIQPKIFTTTKSAYEFMLKNFPDRGSVEMPFPPPRAKDDDAAT